jgi:CHASE2 domain-containing sensor protein
MSCHALIAHIPQGRLTAALTAAMQGNPLVYGIQLALGMACSVLGGYVAGVIARHNHMLNGAISSWLCLALGIYTLRAGKDSHSVTTEILMLALSPVLAVCGGYIANRGALEPFRQRR